jgi:PAS domain S-box-containing protein
MWSGSEVVGREPRRPLGPAPTADSLGVLRLAFEGAPHGVVVSGEDGTIRFVNSLASSMFGYRPGELVGQPVSRLLPRPASGGSDEHWADAWLKSQSQAMAGRTVAGIRRDGVMLPLEIGLNRLEDGNTRHVIASITDVTARLDLEARLAAATNAHLGFQRLVADVAARFGAVAPEGMDDALIDSLRQTG